jgi:hypothetical protein
LVKKLSNTVRSLLATSLGLPGMQDLLAQEAPDEGLSYQLTHYDEEPLASDRVAAGSPVRYSIDSQQLRWVKSLMEGYGLSIEALYEGMSGSSPWFVLPGVADGPVQVMSGATIRDHRSQIDISLSRNSASRTHTAALGYSSEDDYRAIYGRYTGERESGDGLSTFAWGASFSHDRIEPTDAALYGRVPQAARRSISASGSLTRILNPNALVQIGVALTREAGYLSDPYKRVWVDGAVLNDSRPDRQFAWVWSTRFRQYIEPAKAALHLDGRYYGDDWGTRSITLDAEWHRAVREAWEIAPGIRYYSQLAPGFYGPVFDAAPDSGYWSSDYRLATYGAISYNLQAILRKEGWSFSLFAEYYDSRGSLALFGSPQDTPGLVDFWRVTARLTVGR